METLELSVMSYDDSTRGLQDVLAEFEARHHVKVHVVQVPWENGWTQIVKYALYGDAPAVSEIGSTWVASIASMNALRPYTLHELASFGGESAFLATAWNSGQLHGDSVMWAMPWLAETRVIFYRRDLLAAAGVDEQTAFQTTAQLIHTLERLKASGIRMPWCVPTQPTLTTFHNIVSWVWGAGGDLIDLDWHQIVFHEDAARAGLQAYYDLYRFLPPDHRYLDPFTADELFATGHAAAILSGPWLLSYEQLRDPGFMARIGVALPPGVPLVSESHLVVWKSIPARHEKLAIELVRFLTDQPAQLTCSQQVGLLPVRLEALDAPPFSTHPILRVMSQGVKMGRAFPAVRLWGLIEDRLTPALGNIWAKILSADQPDVDAVIRTELEPLALRLNRILQDSPREEAG
jgi:multiple sugar transport system substrate-binding protein